MRAPAQLVERARGHDEAAAHDGDPVCHQLGLAEHVRGHDQRGAALALLVEVAAHVGGGDRVEARGRLVAEDPVRRMQRRPDERDLLRHAARVGGEHRVATVRELETLEQSLDALAPYLGRDAVQEAEMIQVLGRGVAAIQSGLVGDDAEPRPHRVEALG
jgi:hypothetical protein